MSEAFPTDWQSLPGALARRVDQLCDHFEAAWQAAGSENQRPRIEEYLVDMAEPERSVCLRELIVLEMEQRCRINESIQLEEYQARFPGLEPEWLAAAMQQHLSGGFRSLAPVDIGQTVSHYRIENRLGSGGMGVVYEAHDTRLGRSVALKFLPAEYARDRQGLARFQREARTASALNHPHICTIHDIDVHDGQPFLVMELIRGCTLRQLARQRLLLDVLARVGEQAAKALAVAHAAGVVHRDIKPDNIMVRDDGYVKVVDFGLARSLPTSILGAAADVADATPPGTLVGTLRYMAPEQARGQAAGSASDIFALGIILYELATGHHPFESDSPIAVLHAILTQLPITASRLNPEIAAPLETLLERMLEKDPQLRPSADQVAAVLADVARLPVTRSLGSAPAPGQRRTVGRDKERAELYAGYESAAAGRGLLLCVGGEPGIGKTTVVEDFLHDLTAERLGVSVARGRCSERLAGAEAYLPFLEGLDSLLHGDVGEQAARIMKLVAPTWYVQVVPLVAEDPSFERVLADARTASQERLKRELAALLHEVSRLRPLVLFIDDVHWADVSTVDLLAYIGTKCAAMRLLLVLTYRDSDLLLSKHPFLPVKLDLQGRNLCREIQLPFLSHADIERYLALEFPEHGFVKDFAALVHARTEGNPLFMVDVLRYMRECGVIALNGGRWVLTQAVADIRQELPESVRSMIRRKIDQLSEADRRLLVAASVQGQEFEAAVLAKALTLDAADVEERLEVLERVHAFVRHVAEKEFPDGTLTLHYRFVHVLYQNALYALLSPTRKAALSAAVAEALLDNYREERQAIASEVAILFESARDFARAADHFLLASQNASRIYANREGIALAQRALANAQKVRGETRPSRLLRVAFHLAELHRVLSQFEDSIADFQLAEQVAEESGNRDALISALCGMGMACFTLRRYEQTRQLGQRALALAHAAQSSGGVASAQLVLGLERTGAGDLASAELLLDHAVAGLKDGGAPQHAVEAIIHRGQVYMWRSEYQAAERSAEEGLQKARALGVCVNPARNLFQKGIALGNQGRLSEALGVLAEAVRQTEENGERHWLSRLPNTLGWLHGELQDLDRALQLDHEGVRLGQEVGFLKAVANSHINLGHDYLVLGEPARAREHLQEAERLYDQNIFLRWRFNIRLQAELASYGIARGDLLLARTHATASLQQAEQILARKHMAWAHKLHGDIAVLEERLEEGEREYAAALAILQRYPCPLIEWKILKAAAEVAKLRKNDAVSEKLRGRSWAVVGSLAAAVHDDKLRQTFLTSEAVRNLNA